ncbi:hypothetical protein DKX38_015785 [Salix brachista]|uniref:Uncharacterized protein n=1 Tax=Salix brachista TaxID=2182728 RepID=A0A5N5L6D7_9ROSI|nr:hypothetical protein DKX38_015785 [Salix brachista]
MIVWKGRSIQLNKGVGNMQSTFSMAKAMSKLFAKSKGQSNRYGTGFDFYSIIVKSFLDEDILMILIEFTYELDLFSYDSNLFCADMLQSSLAAARADNFYYPPEWSPKKGGLNKFHGQHALRERARKFDQGLLIIRYALWFCLEFSFLCTHISRGSCRFYWGKHAYRAFQIWTFTMKSACCKHEIVIQTDPKNCKYVIISGAQVGKNEEFDIEDAETFALPADEGKHTHLEEDLPKKKEAEPVLVRLQRVLDARHLDDFSLIKTPRARMRSQKKRVVEEEATSKKMGPGIRMLPTTEEDAASAAHVKFSSKFDKNR